MWNIWSGIGRLAIAQNRRSTDYKAPKLWNLWSGGRHQHALCCLNDFRAFAKSSSYYPLQQWSSLTSKIVEMSDRDLSYYMPVWPPALHRPADCGWCSRGCGCSILRNRRRASSTAPRLGRSSGSGRQCCCLAGSSSQSPSWRSVCKRH